MSGSVLRCQWLLSDAGGEPLADAALVLDGGTVVALGPWSQMAAHADGPVIRLDGLTVPGLVDAHNHLRGLPLDHQEVSDAPLERWLLQLRTLTALDWADEALISADQLIGTGVTAVQGVLHGFDPPARYAAQVDAVADVLVDSGLRAELAVGLSDQAEYAPPGITPPELAETLAVPRDTTAADLVDLVAGLRAGRPTDPTDDRVGIGVAPVGPQWCSEELLTAAATLAGRGVRVHTHLLESPAQRGWLPTDPLARLRTAGLLAPTLSVAHGVWLDDVELAELAAAGVAVVHCPTSNQSLQVGRARVGAWWRAGVHAALGTDSAMPAGRLDMFAQLRAALDTAREVGEPLTARQVLAMATRGGAAALGLADRVGVLAVGRAADLVVIQDLPSPTAGASSDDLVEELVAYGSPDAVSHVYCAGQPLRQDGRNVLADRATSARRRLRAVADADAPARRHRQQEAGELVESVLGCLRQAGIPLSGQGSQVGYAP